MAYPYTKSPYIYGRKIAYPYAILQYRWDLVYPYANSPLYIQLYMGKQNSVG